MTSVQPMRAAFVNATHKWGGVKTWCLDMAQAMRELGHEVLIVGRPGPFVDKARALGIEALEGRFGVDASPLSIAWFYRLFRTRRVTHVITNVAKDMRTAGLAARLAGLPVCQHVGAVGDLRDSPRLRLTHGLIRPCYVACSEFVRQGILGRVPFIPPAAIAAIHPGTTVAVEPPQPPHAPRRIIATSQLNPDKGHAELLPALAALRAEGLAFEVAIAGTGSCAAQLREQATALGLDGVLRWVGFRTDIPALLAQSDVFVLPTFEEPLGIALEEAMAHGLIPVARRAGGVPEIWPAGLERLLFDPGEGPGGFERCLRHVLSASSDEVLAWKNLVWGHAAASFEARSQCEAFLGWLATRPWEARI